MSKYLLADLQVGMHVKIPRNTTMSSWANHLEEDRWWEITKIERSSFQINDNRGFGYVPDWITECIELDGTDFSPVEDIQSLFEMMVIS